MGESEPDTVSTNLIGRWVKVSVMLIPKSHSQMGESEPNAVSTNLIRRCNAIGPRLCA